MPGEGRGCHGRGHRTAGGHKAGPVAPSFSHKQPEDQGEPLPAARASYYQQRNNICSLQRRAFPTSSAAASPWGTDRGRHPRAAWPAARLRRPRSPFSAAPVIFILNFLMYQLVVLHPAPLCLAAGLQAGRGGNAGLPSPKEAAHLQTRKQREKKMLVINEMKG